MARKKTTVYVDEDLLRAAKVLAARQGRRESDVLEEALRRFLGLDLIRGIAHRSGLSEEDADRIAYEELHAQRAGR